MTADDALVAADERARVAALDVTRSFIVQAPAGSGKTELLIQRYLKLLSIVEQPEEVLAITFTRKAAFEMQKRVVTAMQEAIAGVEGAEGHRLTTRDAARRALERDREKGWRLVESPHRLRIQTIDALNAAIARSLPVTSGLGAAVDVASEDTARSLYRAASAATLDWLAAGGNNGLAVERLLLHLDNNSSLYVEHIARMLETRDQWLGITGTGQEQRFDEPAVRRRLERNIAGQIAMQLEKVKRLLPAELAAEAVSLTRFAAGSLAGTDGANALQGLDERRAVPEVTADEIDTWRAIAGLLLTRSGNWRKTVNVKSGFPPSAGDRKQQMLTLLEALAGRSDLAAELHRIRHLPAPRYTDEQWDVLLALLRVLPLAVAELRRILAERRITDYVEVAMAAHAALGSMDDPGDIALLLDCRVTHLLIDEMQDTSIAQYELVEKLVAGWQAGDGRTLFCVGDPMQSIYRFRNAEVGEFLIARENGVGDVSLAPLLLRRNFRSGENLVQWFNAVFPVVFPAADDIATGAIAYAESAPVAAQGGAGSVRVHPVFGGDRQEAACGLRVIRDTLQRNADDTMAVLVRSRTQLLPLLVELRTAGIEYQAVDIDRLTELPEIVDLLALTRAVCHRSDRIAWLALLRGPWIGLHWSDLHALVENDSAGAVWDLMHDAARLARLSPDGAARLASLREELAPWLEGHGARTLQETVERLWYRLGGPALLEDVTRVDNVYRFLDVLGRMETAGTLADAAELEARLGEERVPASAAAGTRLQIMTMHKAKGLQFDHVVLYGLGHRPGRGSKPVLNWLTTPGRRGGTDILISPLGPRAGTANDPLHDLIEARLGEKDEFEQDRLLYVACTRARKTLHLIGHVPAGPDGGGPAEPHAGSLLRRIWPAVRPQFEAAFAGHVAAAEARPPERLRLPERYRLRTFMPRPELPPLPDSAHPDAAAGEADRRVDYDWAGTTARHAGSIVHRCLQWLTEGRLTADGLGERRFLALAERLARELGAPAARIDDVCVRARNALERVMRDDTGRWIVFGPGRAELAVTGIHGDGVRSVVIDRVRVDDRGTHWIVDYKTGVHEGGDLERFIAREVDRYRPQLTLYASLYRSLTDAPVRAALYFPLLQQFREVPLGKVLF